MITTDFHSHILPGIDDGSVSAEMSVAMLLRMAQQGITRVVATPHFYPHRNTLERFFARRENAVRQLQQAMEGYPGLPQIILGAEVYYFAGISRSEILPRLAIGNTGCILIEMPHAPWTEEMYRELENIRIRHGLIPIIAHLDRYITPLRQYGIPERVQQMDVLVQLNGSFFLHRGNRRLARKLLEKDCIHLIGSDCHDMAGRAPNLDLALEAIRQQMGEHCLERMAQYERYVLDK